MMTFLRNAWYAAMWSQSLEADTLEPRTILDTPLVFFRTHEGVTALLDICPHRFAPLHRGKVVHGNRVRCPYHGLEFDATGACVRNPHGNERIPSACTVSRFHCAEKHSMVWVWMGEQTPDPSLIPDYSFLDEDAGYVTSRRDYIEMDANYRLVANNLLDLSHAPYLHEGILGYEDSVKADISIWQDGPYVYVRRIKRNVRPAELPDLLYKQDGKNVDVLNTIRWSAPCHLLNDNLTFTPGEQPKDGAGLLGAHILTPISESRTRYHFAAARQGTYVAPVKSPEESAIIQQKLSDLRRMAFEEQDEPIIAAQQALMARYPHHTASPVLLEIDAGPERCGRMLDEMIAAERKSREIKSDQ